MANRKDMRRSDLIVPHIETKRDSDTSDFVGSMTNTLPIAAMFTRNKMLAWTAMMFAIQGWMSETKAQRATATMPGYGSFLMALSSVAVGYLPLFLAPPDVRGGQGIGTEAPAAAPV